jgi:hypothetical protein
MANVPHHRYPLDDSPEWDVDAAEARWRKHFSSDGSGDKDTINWREYAKGFLTVTGDGKHFGDYHYLHHDIKDGQPVTVWGGVKAAAGRADQNLSGPELHSAQHHLGEHFHEFGKTPPWEHKPEQAHLDDAGEVSLLDDAQGAVSIPLPRIGAPPPKRIRLFKWGWNDTTKGRLKLDQQGADALMAAFRKRGVSQTFDLWHSTFDPNLRPEDKKTYGNYLLSVEGSEASGEGGVFATECQFSPDIAKEISDGKWPYVSPVPLHTKDGRIVDIKNTALVGLPATHNAQPLLMSLLSALPLPPKKEPTKMSKHLKKVLSTGQHYMAALKELADHGEPEHRELANDGLAKMGQYMQKCAEAAGEHHAGYIKELAEEEELAGRKLSLLSSLETEFGTTDPDVIEGKVFALQTRHSTAAKKEQAAVLKLLDGRKDDVPALMREKMLKRPLSVVTAYLSELDADGASTGASDLPRGQRSEKQPPAPTTANTQQLAGNEQPKALKLSDLDDNQKGALSAIQDLKRRQLGDKYDEQAVTTTFLSELNASLGSK